MRPMAALSALVLLLAAASAPAADARREWTVRFTPQDRETGRYQYVPFEVPAGTTRFTLTYAYDRADGTNVIDLGLFEPGPTDLGGSGFRGWSGGERQSVTVGVAGSTPGYWPGPLPAGRWNVMLGLYKVAAPGVDVTLTLETSDAPAGPTPRLAPRPTGALRAGPAWYSGGLHLHTVHSDGKHTTADVCRRAREAGLDFVVITDHNNTTHQLDPIDEPGLLRMVGEEVTTPGGHANVWGLSGWREVVDFRVLPGDPRIRDVVAAAVKKGALVSINHPRSPCVGCSWEHEVPDGVTGIEITNGGHPAMEQAIALWDSLLQKGRRITAVGASDWHRPDHAIDFASVRVFAPELSEKAVLEGIRRGRVVVMADGSTPPPVLRARAGAGTAAVGDTLAVAKGAAVTWEVEAPVTMEGARVDLVWNGVPVDKGVLAAGQPLRFSRPAETSGYGRIHVFAPGGAPLALTNPVWLDVR